MSNEKKTNLELWESVDKTDEKYTEKGDGKGYAYTTVAPMSVFKKATKIFGIFGIGWGVRNAQYSTILDEKVLVYKAELFYNHEDKEHTIELDNCWILVSAKGRIDDEAYKKVRTNAIKKGLAMLGFDANIYMGDHEDDRNTGTHVNKYPEPDMNRDYTPPDDGKNALLVMEQTAKKAILEKIKIKLQFSDPTYGQINTEEAKDQYIKKLADIFKKEKLGQKKDYKLVISELQQFEESL